MDTFAGGIGFNFRIPPKYWITGCFYNSGVEFPENIVPSETSKIWRITLNRISNVGIVVYCNDVEVLNIAVSDVICTDSNWSEYWSREVGRIYFNQTKDTATDFYYQPLGTYLA